VSRKKTDLQWRWRLSAPVCRIASDIWPCLLRARVEAAEDAGSGGRKKSSVGEVEPQLEEADTADNTQQAAAADDDDANGGDADGAHVNGSQSLVAAAARRDTSHDRDQILTRLILANV